MLIFLVFICLILVYLIISLVQREANLHTRNLLNRIVEENKNFKLYRSYKQPFDYAIVTPKNVYLIRLLRGLKNTDIQIDNNKWYVRTSPKRKYKKYRKIDNFLDYNEKLKRKVIKLVIIYPNAKAILHKLNDEELEYLYPDSKSLPYQIISYERLDNYHDYIEENN